MDSTSASCRYCQRRQSSLDIPKTKSLSSRGLQTHFRNFTRTRRKGGACLKCQKDLDVIVKLRTTIRANQKLLKHQTPGFESQIVIKVEQEDVENDYKDPLTCIETKFADQLKEKCDMCDLSFEPEALKEHIESEHGNPNNPEIKLEAKEEIKNKTTEQDNQNQNVPNDEQTENSKEKPHRCNLCGTKFVKKQSLIPHMLQQHKIDVRQRTRKFKEIDKTFECHFCGHRTCSKGGMRRHIVASHLKVTTTFHCIKCNKDIELSHKSGHWASCTQGKKPKFQCCQCQKLVTDEATLRQHFDDNHTPFSLRVIKSKKRRWVCSYCNQVFIYKKSLELHYADNTYREKANNLLNPIVCETCGKSFINSFLYKKHNSYYHATVDMPESFICDAKGCGKGFNNKEMLRLHIRYHKEPKYQCNFCDAAFYYPGQLDSHVKSFHSNGQPLTCPTCGETFLQRAVYSEHINEHK